VPVGKRWTIWPKGHENLALTSKKEAGDVDRGIMRAYIKKGEQEVLAHPLPWGKYPAIL